MKEVDKTKREPKQYLENISRRNVYGFMVAFACVAGLLVLFVPHYKPLKLASLQESTDAHRAIIHKYFVENTTCQKDNRDKTDRVKTFNTYFKTNQFGNRAVFRGCQDKDVFLAKNDKGEWVQTKLNLDLDNVVEASWIKACLLDDIVKPNAKAVDSSADKKYLHTQPGYDAENNETCNRLAKESYVEVNFKQGIRFNF